uniref:ARAD1C22990p n=1 Tax=Blastobotrys adeninivorans TaxID=409370 RepID=A0A060T7M2_BLAAD
MKPLTGPTDASKTGLEGLPDIILGAGVFNTQYHDNPESLPADQVIRRAFELGIRAIDTSAYYGPSEEIVGRALKELEKDYPRESYYICTKAGRNGVNQFDYAASDIRKSVQRSLQRLNTTYLDVLYIHDVEFVDTAGCLEAIGEAFKLKQEGVVRFVGISGYPVSFLAYLANKVKQTLGPLDIVLTYCNYCLQNTILEKYLGEFDQAGVSKVLNASPLSMSLLRSQVTHSFHPASEVLKERVAQAAKLTRSKGEELADVASRFVFKHWQGCTVFGLQSVPEVEAAVQDYWMVKDGQWNDQLVDEVRNVLGDCIDMVWESGIEHADQNDQNK